MLSAQFGAEVQKKIHKTLQKTIQAGFFKGSGGFPGVSLRKRPFTFIFAGGEGHL